MPALISEILATRDNYEVVRDQIGAILAVEFANQKVLTGLEQPRVFLERTNPWGEFLDAPEEAVTPEQPQPIINVWFETWSGDGAASNIVERQKVEATYNIDCYGCGISKDDGFNAGGHLAADRVAAYEAQRAARLVRQILMSAHYTYLAMRGVVWKRWVQSVTMFQPQIDNKQAQRVVGGRLAFQVQFNEFSPQNAGEILEIIGIEVLRAETGQLYLRADYPH